MKIEDVYSEVYKILNILGNDYIEKIPKELYNHIEENLNEDNEKQFYIDKPIAEQNLSQEALEFIAYLNLQYWCESEEEKQNLLKNYKENEEKFEKELQEKYNIDNIFKVRKKTENVKQEMIIKEKKESFIRRIFNKIKNIFRGAKNEKN